MANSDVLKRFLDAGVSFTQMTRDRAEKLVRDLVQLGELRVDETQQAVQELVDRGRESTEQLTAWISSEVRKQMEVVADRMDGLEERMDDVARSMGLRKSTAKKSAAKKSTAKSTAKKSTAKRTPAKKSTAKKSTAKKSAAKKSTAKKSTARKSTAQRTPAKKAAKKAAG